MKYTHNTAAILCLLLVSAMISCGDSEASVDTAAPDNTPDTSITETAVDDDRLPAPAVTDMNGAELRIMNPTPESFNWATTTILVEEAADATHLEGNVPAFQAVDFRFADVLGCAVLG